MHVTELDTSYGHVLGEEPGNYNDINVMSEDRHIELLYYLIELRVDMMLQETRDKPKICRRTDQL